MKTRSSRLLPSHPEFPAFRQCFAPMKAARAKLGAQHSAMDLEASAGPLLPGEVLRELRDVPGSRCRWLPMLVIFWTFLSMVLNPGMACREAQRGVQAWWIRRGRIWRSVSTSAFCMARKRLPIAWLRKLWWRLADRLAAAAPELAGTYGRRVLVVDGTDLQCPGKGVGVHFQLSWGKSGGKGVGVHFQLSRSKPAVLDSWPGFIRRVGGGCEKAPEAGALNRRGKAF